MKKLVCFIVTALLVAPLVVSDAVAADTTHKFPVKHAKESKSGKNLLDVPFYMKGQDHPAAAQTFGEFKSNKKSNAFRKSAQAACDQAFSSALIALQQRAQREGGNAVIDVYSITKNVKYENAEKYSCVAGGVVVHVALMGTVATIE